MKVKVDLSKFKLKHKNETHATLVHPDGHEVKLSVKALHPMNRKNLDGLKMADGGTAYDPFKHPEGQAPKEPSHYSKADESVAAEDDKPKAHKAPADSTGFTSSAEKHLDTDKTSKLKAFASGGEINPKLEQSRVDLSRLQPQMKPVGGVRAAEGGELEVEELEHPVAKNPVDYEPVHQPKVEKLEHPEPKHPIKYEKMAEGGEAEQSSDQQPIVINNMPPAPQLSPAEMDQMGMQGMPSQQPAQPKDQGMAAQPQQPQQPQQPKADNMPTTMGGYQQQAAGIQGQAKAESKGQAEQAKVMAEQAGAVNQLMTDHQAKVQEIETERKALMQDYLDGHIDPNRFMGSKDTTGRILTGIGLALGGLGAGLNGGSNQALDFLNKQIDRDIDAQKADLGKKHTLLSMNMDRLKDENAAVQVTRMQMQDLMSAKIGQSAAKAQSAIAKSRGQQLLGQLQQQTAPVVQQMAVRDMLSSAKPEQLQKMDPSQLVTSIVPPDKQKEVTHEIALAQNAKINSDNILKHFDEASKENTVAGRVSRLGFTPPSILSMRSMMLPLIHDLEGRVNEFEQKTTSDLEPKPGDKASTISAKKKALVEFLAQKSSAPMAKSFGLDLEKFGSTAKPGTLTPEQNQYVQWAKANPNDPRSKLVLKKLNVE